MALLGLSAAKAPSFPHLVPMGHFRKEGLTQFPLEETGQAWPLLQLLSHHMSPGAAHLCSEAVCGLQAFSSSGGTQECACHMVFHSNS